MYPPPHTYDMEAVATRGDAEEISLETLDTRHTANRAERRRRRIRLKVTRNVRYSPANRAERMYHPPPPRAGDDEEFSLSDGEGEDSEFPLETSTNQTSPSEVGLLPFCSQRLKEFRNFLSNFVTFENTLLQLAWFCCAFRLKSR